MPVASSIMGASFFLCAFLVCVHIFLHPLCLLYVRNCSHWRRFFSFVLSVFPHLHLVGCVKFCNFLSLCSIAVCRPSFFPSFYSLLVNCYYLYRFFRFFDQDCSSNCVLSFFPTKYSFSYAFQLYNSFLFGLPPISILFIPILRRYECTLLSLVMVILKSVKRLPVAFVQ